MKKILLLLLIIVNFNVYSSIDTLKSKKESTQDTIIKSKILECHFSYKYRNPIYVKYTLYKGGGDCNRSKYHFKTGKVKNSATADDYAHSGYDIGHLASAEDFAFNCGLDSLTFFFYNAVPQTPNLNRGIWKTYEERIRELSQKDSLLIICGAVFPQNYKTLNNKGLVAIPSNCWKVVKSLSTGKILYILWFTNEMEDHNSVQSKMTLEELEKKIGFTLNLK